VLAERCGVPPTPRPGQGETLCRPHTETNCRWVTFPVMPWSWRSGMRASGELRRTEAADQNTRRNLARNRVWVPQVASRQRSPKGETTRREIRNGRAFLVSCCRASTETPASFSEGRPFVRMHFCKADRGGGRGLWVRFSRAVCKSESGSCVC
jgi:hypothetical protein